MVEPLNYYDGRGEAQPAAAAPGPRPAIPVEFDAVLARTADHAGARAVELQLKREGVEVYRCDGSEYAGRGVELHVRSGDLERASQIAGEVFARRKKVRALLGKSERPEGMGEGLGSGVEDIG